MEAPFALILWPAFVTGALIWILLRMRRLEKDNRELAYYIIALQKHLDIEITVEETKDGFSFTIKDDFDEKIGDGSQELPPK
jgi:hypothetical protein